MDKKMVTLKINDIPVTVPEGTTVLEAARNAGIKIPSLCYLKGINEIGAASVWWRLRGPRAWWPPASTR